MRVTNDPNRRKGDPFEDLLRIQSEFTARLAEETMRFFRRLQGSLGPVTPGTVVGPDPKWSLSARAAQGGRASLTLEIENRQRVHCLVTPMLAPLVEASGTTWFPVAEVSPPSILLAPDEVHTVTVELPAPADLPAGTYRGALLLPGFRAGGIPVTVTIESEAATTAKKRRPKRSNRPTPRPRRKGTA